MNYFLILVILLICGGAFYEHTQQEEVKANDQEQITDLQVKIEPLTTENQKLQEEKKVLETELAEKGKTIDDLNAEVASLKKLTPILVSSSSAESGATKATEIPLPPTTDSTSLGTITTTDQKTYQDCYLLKVDSDGLTFRHSEGITKILFPSLSPALQKQYGFDPLKTPAVAPP